ncbi:hypothetical protein D3C81_2241890 [compost metagenome]
MFSAAIGISPSSCARAYSSRSLIMDVIDATLRCTFLPTSRLLSWSSAEVVIYAAAREMVASGLRKSWPRMARNVSRAAAARLE